MSGKKRLLISVVSGICTFIVLAVVFKLLGLVPFESRENGYSLAYDDAYFQFIDFLAYFKDVLSGKQSIEYSFSNYLGQGGIAFFSYYLSTPFNLLLLFLKKHHILLFFDSTIVLKMCLTASTFAWFLTGRFKERLPFVFSVSLSVGFGLMQYMLHHGYAGISTLDGVYMLPLMMLGVYYVVDSGKMSLLAVTTGLAIVFNWYVAGVDCVFSGVYFLTELLLFIVHDRDCETLPSNVVITQAESVSGGSKCGQEDENAKNQTENPAQGKVFEYTKTDSADSKENLDFVGSGIEKDKHKPIMMDMLSKTIIGRIGRYVASMLTGVLISAILFLPTIYELKLGKADGMDWYLFGWGLRGNPLELVHNYYPGSGYVWNGMGPTVFCGSFALIGALGVFSVSRKAISLKEKLVYGAFLIVMALMVYWKPLYLMFSLFKEGTGHTGRYLYLGCFMLIYVAAVFFSNLKDANWKLFMAIVAAYIGVFVLLAVREPLEQENACVIACVFIAVSAVLALIYNKVRGKGLLAGIISAAVVIVCCIEGGYNARIVLDNYISANNAEFESYEAEGQRLIDSLKEYDDGYYRVTQTMNRDMTLSDTTANYDESFCFDYASIGGYTSTPHASQLEFLQKGGYRNEDATPTVVQNTPVIPLDTMLGVKYVLSPYEIKGFTKIDEIESGNGKDVYMNPNALPMMFMAGAAIDNFEMRDRKDFTGASEMPDREKTNSALKTSDISANTDPESMNPFEYNNYLFGRLTGRKEGEVALFKPVEFNIQDSEEARRYEIQAPSGNYALYGYLPWTERVWGGADIDINGVISMPYSHWNSLDLFYIPDKAEEGALSDAGGETEGQPRVSAERNNSVYIELKGYDPGLLKAEVFYALDLDMLSELTSMLKAGKPDHMELENGRVSAKITAKEDGEMLFMSIPYDAGWEIRDNGEQISPEVFESSLMTIPLHEGENEITMEYHIPMFKIGMLFSAIGILFMIFMIRYDRKNTHSFI